MQALAVVRLQECLSGGLVVPGLVGGTRLHRREHAHQAWIFATLGERLLHQIFLPDIALAKVPDLDPGLCRQDRQVIEPPVDQRDPFPKLSQPLPGQNQRAGILVEAEQPPLRPRRRQQRRRMPARADRGVDDHGSRLDLERVHYGVQEHRDMRLWAVKTHGDRALLPAYNTTAPPA